VRECVGVCVCVCLCVCVGVGGWVCVSVRERVCVRERESRKALEIREELVVSSWVQFFSGSGEGGGGFFSQSVSPDLNFLISGEFFPLLVLLTLRCCWCCKYRLVLFHNLSSLL